MTDLLTSTLDLLHLRSAVYCQSQIHTTPWALRFIKSPHAVFHIVSEGTCTVTICAENAVDNRTEDLPFLPLRLHAGDLLLLPRGDMHLIADGDYSSWRADIDLNDYQAESCRLMRWGDDPTGTTLICGLFIFDSSQIESIAALLPPVLVFTAADTRRVGLESVITALVAEANSQQPGRDTILTRLTDILFVAIVRAWLLTPGNTARGWLGMLRDPHLALALSRMHSAPAEAWTVHTLAKVASMSRSAFTEKFTSMMGEPPAHYLARWRLQLACRLLQRSDTPVGEVATQVGYKSEMAFNKAFKRTYGITPGRYRRLDHD